MHVLVGTMNAYTPHAVRYSREAEELGADGLMIIPPYYYTPTDDEIFNYYKAICEKVSIPIMLYNNPFTSNVDMSAKLVARLTKAFEQVRYIKEASMDVARVHDVIEETKGVMNVFAGERIVESYLLGAIGYVNPLRQPHPARLLSHLRFHRRGPHRGGEEDRAAHPQDAGHHQRGPSDLRPPVLFQGVAAAAGYPVGDVRPPLTTFKELGKEGEARLKKLQPIMRELAELVDRIEAQGARSHRLAAE
jgi:4-hydroxy-tetrahydrodipicolinate synthase